MRAIARTLLGAVLVVASLAVLADEIDINQADAETLAALNGVGLAKAQAIVAYRKEHGPFRTVDDLAKIKGIGMATINKNREQITVGKRDGKRRQAAAE